MAVKRARVRAPQPSTGYRPTASGGRILNCIPSRNVERDWPAEAALRPGMAAAPGAIPASKDLREDSWWRIGDQGHTGSCVGWATADSVIRWHFVKAGRIAKNDKLSVRYVWMAAKETDEFTLRPTTFIESDGTSLKAALDIARKYGVAREVDLPFLGGNLYGGDAIDFYGAAAQLRIASYYRLTDSVLTKLNAYKQWLALRGPILTRLYVDATWMNVGSDGVLTKYKPETAIGGHAVALVGYTSKHFIVRNSWGDGANGWGDDGYGYASYAYTINAFTEAYGVVP